MGLQHKLDDPLAVSSIQAARDFYRELEQGLAGQDYFAGALSFAISPSTWRCCSALA